LSIEKLKAQKTVGKEHCFEVRTKSPKTH